MRIQIAIFLTLFLFASSVAWQAIRTDLTLTGAGITGDELKVDTTVMATQTDLLNERGNMNVISPAQITADQDDYTPTGWAAASVVRLSTDSDMQAITSVAAYTGASASDKAFKTLVNVGSYMIYFPMDHPDGTAANRFTGHYGDYKLYPGKSCDIYYDETSDRWRILDQEQTDGIKGLFYSFMAGSITAADYGDVIFTILGTGTSTSTAATTTLPASAQLGTSTNTTWGYMLSFAKSVNQIYAFGSAHIYTEALVSIPTLSALGEDFDIQIQITPSPTNTNLEQNNSIGLRYSYDVNGGEWQLYSEDNAGGEDLADSNVSVAAATLYKIRIEMDKSKTEARAYINDAYVGKVESNMPNSVAVSTRILIKKTSGATARSLNVHNFSSGAIYP